MIICDVCGGDPAKLCGKPELQQNPWALVSTPPPTSGLPAVHICWWCWSAILGRLITFARRELGLGKPKADGEEGELRP